MSKKTDEAILKMTKECERKEYLIPFEEYLTGICTNDRIAEKILQEGKSLQGSFEKMRGIASERRQGNVAYIPDEEGFRIIEEYYGITEEIERLKRNQKEGIIAFKVHTDTIQKILLTALVTSITSQQMMNRKRKR